jgi:hypothetical protein
MMTSMSMSRTSAYRDDIAIVPRLGAAEVAMLCAALEQRARTYLVSAEMLGAGAAELADRDRKSAAQCRALADRLQRLTRTMKGNRG